jgi:hypothetical protein
MVVSPSEGVPTANITVRAGVALAGWLPPMTEPWPLHLSTPVATQQCNIGIPSFSLSFAWPSPCPAQFFVPYDRALITVPVYISSSTSNVSFGFPPVPNCPQCFDADNKLLFWGFATCMLDLNFLSGAVEQA